MTCATCAHLQRLNETGGLCRRHAPHATVVGRFRAEYGGNTPAWPNESATLWPPVNNHDSCGEWAALPTPPLAVEPDREG